MRTLLAIYTSLFFGSAMPGLSSGQSETILASSIDIIWYKAEGREDYHKNKKTSVRDFTPLFREGCRNLGRGLTAAKGIYGQGVFKRFVCYIDDKKIYGKTQETPWTLEVLDDQTQLLLTLRFKAMEIGRLSVPPSRYNLDFLRDSEFAGLVSLSILELMPIAYRLVSERSYLPFNNLSKKRRPKYVFPRPPERLVLYHLEWDYRVGIWVSQVLGEASLIAGRGGRYRYRIGFYDEKRPRADVAVFAHDQLGPDTRQEEFVRSVVKAHRDLLNAAEEGHLESFIQGESGLASIFLDSAAAGYVGLRYGIQALSGDPLLAKTSVFGLLLEIRGGPLGGIRYYYDLLPKAVNYEKDAAGTKIETNITWSRHVIGYSLGFDPVFLVDQITLDPKIGVWNFDARLITARLGDGSPVTASNFSLGSTVNLALELGFELFSPWYTLRTWYSFDSGFALIKSGGNVTSSRFGFDTFFTAGPSLHFFGEPVRLAVLGFAMFELVSLKSGSDEDAQAGEEKIIGVDYFGGYAGMGLALSW